MAARGPQIDPAGHQTGRRAVHQIATDLRKHQKVRYFSSCRAITTRWIWLVPS
jgi:hypothetical protein